MFDLTCWQLQKKHWICIFLQKTSTGICLLNNFTLYEEVLKTHIKQTTGRGSCNWFSLPHFQPFQKQNVYVTCGNLLHRSIAMMQKQAAEINSNKTKAFLTITTEGWAGCAGSRSESSSSIPSESPSTSVTVSSMVACFAFIVSILHFEFKEAICSWYPLIFWASSWGNIFFSLM